MSFNPYLPSMNIFRMESLMYLVTEYMYMAPMIVLMEIFFVSAISALVFIVSVNTDVVSTKESVTPNDTNETSKIDEIIVRNDEKLEEIERGEKSPEALDVEAYEKEKEKEKYNIELLSQEREIATLIKKY
nr:MULTISPECIES: hypothetical protein [Paraliobacillus]